MSADMEPVSIPLEPCINFEGMLEGFPVRILKDDGCNTNMVSTEFLSRHREAMVENLKEAEFWIRHSKADTKGLSVESLQKCNLIIQGHPYTSNWAIGEARYDVILGMPWHVENNVKTDYRERRVSIGTKVLRDLTINTRPVEPITTISPISVSKFRKGCRRQQFVELYQILVTDTKDDVQICNKEMEAPQLKDKNPRPNEEEFQKLVDRHKENVPLTNLLQQNKDVFKNNLPNGLPPERDIDHEIEVDPKNEPPYRRLYQLSPAELLAAKEYIDSNLAAGKIRPSKYPYGAPMFFAREKNGKLRGVVDYRALNRITKKNHTAVPRTDEMFDRLGESKVLSKLDLKTVFHQIRVKSQDVEKTAFTTKYGQFEYLVMSMGLCNAPATFQTLRNSILRDVIDTFLVVYLDDLLIFSKNEEEHELHLQLVLKRLQENQLYVSPKKCSLMQQEVKFLGLIVSKDGIRVDPIKVKSVQDWPRPKTLTELRGFLGLVQFFKRFMKGFAAMATPLTDLSKKELGLSKWDPKCTEAFDNLKQTLITAPIFIPPDWDKEFVVHIDASGSALGATLKQRDDASRMRVIAYASRKLNDAEQNYTSNDRELLSIIHGLQKFRCYLEGFTYSVLTDNQVVSNFFTKKNLRRREARWLETLTDFNITQLSLTPGRINVLGDSLSRIPEVNYKHIDVLSGFEELETDHMFGEMKYDQAFGAIFRSFDEEWAKCDKQRKRIELLRPSFNREGNRMFYEGKLCIPRRSVTEILKEAHDSRLSGHFGFAKTMDRLENFHWKHKSKDTKPYCEGCITCQQQKDTSGRQLGDPTALEIPTRRLGMVATDFITTLPKTERGFDGVTTFVDRLSRRVHFIPCRSTDTAIDTARIFFDRIMPQHGLHDALISDRDPRFVSSFWKELFKLCGIQLKMSSSRHPQTDGSSEVMNRMLENYIRFYCDYKQADWDLLLPTAEFAYNSARSDDLNASPFEVHLGWRPRQPLDFLTKKKPKVEAVEDFQAILKGALDDAMFAHKLAKARQSAESAIHMKSPTYKVGDRVWVSRKLLRDAYTKERPSAKLSARRFGPFRIRKLVGRNAVLLELPTYMRTHNVIHVSWTKPFMDKPIGLRDTVPVQIEQPETDENGKELFEVDKILGHRRKGRGYNFLTLMKNVPTHDAEWKPTHDFVAPDGTLADAFEKYIREHEILPHLIEQK